MKALIKYLPANPDGYKGKTWEDKPFVVIRDIKDCTTESMYKILGEVSSGATFVKDGRKYEVMPIYNKDLIYCEYKIKCPCCDTFK